MRIVANFDPATETSDTFNAGFPNNQGRIVVYNESNINLQLSWGGFQTYCPAWTAMLYCIQANSVNINWQAFSQLIANNPPISQVVVEAYNDSEVIVGTFPAPLVRQANLGNSVPLATAATSIQNDGNMAGTPIVEATVAGDSSSAVSMTNTGQFSLGNAANDGFLQITTDAGAHLLKFDTTGNLTVDRGILANLITALAGNDIGLHVATGHRVVATINNVNVFTAQGDGVHLLAGGIFLTQPSMQALSNGNTILIPGAMIQVSCATNVTGIIMTPGAAAGQLVYLYNQGPDVLTFAASGSNVRQGANIVVGNGKLLTMLWDGVNWATNGPV